MENELYHHGRAGQKWHVRNGPPYPLERQQISSSERQKDPRTFNPNEPRNSAGSGSSKSSTRAAKKLERAEARAAAKEEKRVRKQLVKDAAKMNKRKAVELTDDELRARNERLRMEREYGQLLKDIKKQNQGPVAKTVESIVNESIPNAISGSVKTSVQSFLSYELGKPLSSLKEKDAEKKKLRDAINNAQARMQHSNDLSSKTMMAAAKDFVKDVKDDASTSYSNLNEAFSNVRRQAEEYVKSYEYQQASFPALEDKQRKE